LKSSVVLVQGFPSLLVLGLIIQLLQDILIYHAVSHKQPLQNIYH